MQKLIEWELLVEIVLFLRSKKHRTPIDILKSFIKVKDGVQEKISGHELAQLRKVFKFLISARNNEIIGKTRLFRNQIHFYTMITSIISGGLLDVYEKQNLIDKIALFGQLIDNEAKTSNKNLRR